VDCGGVPHLLANGSSGIAVGMADEYPAAQFGELCNAALHLIKHPNGRWRSSSSSCRPDFPPGRAVEPRDSISRPIDWAAGDSAARQVGKEETGAAAAVVITESHIRCRRQVSATWPS